MLCQIYILGQVVFYEWLWKGHSWFPRTHEPSPHDRDPNPLASYLLTDFLTSLKLTVDLQGPNQFQAEQMSFEPWLFASVSGLLQASLENCSDGGLLLAQSLARAKGSQCTLQSETTMNGFELFQYKEYIYTLQIVSYAWQRNKGEENLHSRIQICQVQLTRDSESQQVHVGLLCYSSH